MPGSETCFGSTTDRAQRFHVARVAWQGPLCKDQLTAHFHHCTLAPGTSVVSPIFCAQIARSHACHFLGSLVRDQRAQQVARTLTCPKQLRAFDHLASANCWSSWSMFSSAPTGLAFSGPFGSFGPRTWRLRQQLRIAAVFSWQCEELSSLHCRRFHAFSDVCSGGVFAPTFFVDVLTCCRTLVRILSS